jgi:copper transport protein
MVRRAALIALVALAFPASASAHATLEGTIPSRGAIAKTQPEAVVFRFDEPVEGNFGAVRVFNAQGQRVDQGDAFHPAGKGPQLGVHLKPKLAEGTYTATYRVVSADSHIVSGGFVFSIGKAGAAPGETVGQLLAGSKPGKVTEVAMGAARALEYGAIGVGFGALLFLLAIWLPVLRDLAGGGRAWQAASQGLVRRIRALILAAALVGAVAALAGVVLEAAQAAGVSGWEALKPHVLREVLGTKFGMTWTVAAGAWIVAGVLASGLLAPAARRAPVLRPAALGADGAAVAVDPALWLLAVPLGALLMLPALSGHGATQSPVGVLFPANVAHVAAMSAWLGGLMALLVALPAATRSLPMGPERTQVLARTVGRFSPVALVSVGALLVTGLVQAVVEVRHFDLIFSTAFGRAAFIKVVLLGALIVLGALNRQRTLPQLRAAAEARTSPGQAGVVLRSTLRAEVALIVVVLGVTGALASYAPSIAAVSGPSSATVALGPEQLQLTLDPARVGSNEIHLYLLDPKSGAQFTRAKEVTVTAGQPQKGIGPLDQDAHKAGPGHYIVPNAFLGSKGEWVITVTARVSDFDEYQAKAKVTVR